MRPVIGWCPDPLPTVTRSLGETRSALPTSQSKPAACGRPRDFCYRFQGLCQHSAPAAAAANSLASSGRFPVPVLTLGVPSTIHHPPSHAPPLSTSSGSLYRTIPYKQRCKEPSFYKKSRIRQQTSSAVATATRELLLPPFPTSSPLSFTLVSSNPTNKKQKITATAIQNVITIIARYSSECAPSSRLVI